MKLKSLHIALLVPILLISCYVFSLLFDKITLSNLSRIERETGLSLPQGVRIVEIKMDRFSIADGCNYEWLIESDNDLTEWIEKNMRLEGGPKLPSGGWTEIRSFGEVASLAENETARFPLSGVWRSARKSHKGNIETAYLTVAEGNKVAQLRTFRP